MHKPEMASTVAIGGVTRSTLLLCLCLLCGAVISISNASLYKDLSTKLTAEITGENLMAQVSSTAPRQQGYGI